MRQFEDLVAAVYRFYPRGLSPFDPSSGYDETEEHRRLMRARIQAGSEDSPWRVLLARLSTRFPGQVIQNFSAHLPTGHYDAGYVGELKLPTRGWHEKHHAIRFLISFLVPCYVVYSAVNVLAPSTSTWALARHIDFTFSSDEEPYVRGITEEILSVFPGYEPMPPEVGNALVPDSTITTLYHCLFTESW